MTEAPPWVREFFNPENRINLNKILVRSYPSIYLNLLEPIVLSACEDKWPIFLPLSINDRLWFYATAIDTRELIELKRVLECFLGSADIYPDYQIITQSKNVSEEAILKKSPIGFIRFTILDKFKNDENTKKRVFETLAKILDIYSQRPTLTSNAPRPTGRVLRDFFTSCQTGDGNNADKFLDELRGSGVFSHRNLIFLELQSLYASQSWLDVIQHKSISDILGGRIPKRIFQILLRSYGSTGLEELIQESDFSKFDINNVRIQSERLTLLFQRKPSFDNSISSINDWKLWAIGAASLGYADYKNILPDIIEEGWVNKLNNWTGLEAYIEEVVEQETLLTTPEDLKGVRALLSRALLASKLELNEIVIQLNNMPLELKEQVAKFSYLQNLMDSFHIEVGNNDEHGWNQWFFDISRPEGNLTVLSQRLQNGYLNWELNSFDEVSILNIIQNVTSNKLGGVFRDCLPLLLGWLENEGIECTNNFWISWLELLALDEYVSAQDIHLSEQLINHILAKSFSREDYLKLLEPLEIIWDKGSSPSSYTAVLGLMESLLDASCPDKHARTRFWQLIQSFALTKWNRLELCDQFLTKCISTEIFGNNASEIFPAQESGDDSISLKVEGPNLQGKLVGIYTLTEGAARRAKTILESLFSGVKIDLNHDHSATNGLINLAKKADYFIFSAASSKHQAFYPVTKIRNDLIYPKGKGTSSIVNAFIEKVS